MCAQVEWATASLPPLAAAGARTKASFFAERIRPRNWVTVCCSGQPCVRITKSFVADTKHVDCTAFLRRHDRALESATRISWGLILGNSSEIIYIVAPRLLHSIGLAVRSVGVEIVRANSIRRTPYGFVCPDLA